MGTLVKQECFKLFKKKSTYILPVIIIVIMLALAILGNHYSDVFNLKESFKGGFSSFSWVVFLMIIQASTIISMEFHYGTIKNLLYRNYSRTSIIVSKFITLFIYSLIIFLIFIIISLLLHLIFNGDTSLTEHSKNHISLL
ncbi:ABC transporter permease, partial [Staphylococcus hominis]